jgi:hypothetical protein
LHSVANAAHARHAHSAGASLSVFSNRPPVAPPTYRPLTSPLSSCLARLGPQESSPRSHSPHAFVTPHPPHLLILRPPLSCCVPSLVLSHRENPGRLASDAHPSPSTSLAQFAPALLTPHGLTLLSPTVILPLPPRHHGPHPPASHANCSEASCFAAISTHGYDRLHSHCPLASPFPPLTRPSHFPYARSRTILVLSSPHTSHSSRLTLLTFTPPFPVLSCPPHVQPSPSPSPSRLTPARPSLISLATTSWAYLPPPPGDAVSLRFLVL